MVSRVVRRLRRKRRHGTCRPADTRCTGRLRDTVPIAAIAFDFDPLLRLGDGLVVRWQTVALAAVLAACLIAAGVLARRASHARR